MSCEKDVKNIKLLQGESKLVVTSFISPQDTFLRVSVVKSVPAIGKSSLSSDNMRDATVRMSDGSNWVNLLYNEEQRAFLADARSLPVIPGNTYFLEVTDTEGRKAEASCTVPVNQDISLAIAIDSAKAQYGDYMEYFMTMKWQDTPVEINYYRIFAEISTNHETTGTTYYQPVYFEDSYNNINLYTDTRLDGARFSSMKGSIYKPSYSPQNPVVTTLHGYLLNTDEHYYRYHQSLNNSFNVDGNPFAEPVLIYSNVQGGLGAFGSYNRTTVVMPLK
jgi:hypothetical protein